MSRHLIQLFIFLFAVTPFYSAAKSTQKHDIEVVVHRGANALAPENTVASADSALVHGAKWIEVDVRPSKDGVMFNLHDETLDRTTNGKGNISDWLSADIEKLDCGSWFSDKFRGTHIPTIEAMIDSLDGRAYIYFDVKPGTNIADLVKLVRKKHYTSRSFFWFGKEEMLRQFVSIAPEMTVKVNANDIQRLEYWRTVCKPAIVEVNANNITKEFLTYCHKHHIKVMVGAQGESIDDYRKAIETGADMINLDKPELFEKLQNNSLLSLWQYVDPRIGSEGLGRTFPGPSMPFGMCKPGPDCVNMPNSGWAKMPEAVAGFSQTHVSGTGGGQKYGNILIQPFLGDMAGVEHVQNRTSEEISLGYYKCTYENGIQTEITASDRCAFYRITSPSGERGGLLIDASHFLGEDSIIPNKRETQQFVGSEVEIINDHEVRGYSTVRGGWNDGDAYTIYFCLQSDKPFVASKAFHNNPEAGKGTKSWGLVSFAEGEVNIKVGISCISSLKARENIPSNDFDTQLSVLRNSWEKYLSRIEIKGTDKQKRMFYTGIYHTMLMPVDRTGENPKWTESPYFDDYYAIWDTYRTSSPLLTILCPDKERDIVNSLLNIYTREGYMPDARSGNCNGRTQGGSNAEVVIADAFVKGLEGIDYELALKAMLKDADVPPGGNEEKEGRGGLNEYNTLGYIPYGIDRAGNRTIEYAYDDYCIAELAKGLGHTDIAERFFKQSTNWKNLWRSDYEYDGMKGFIMPKDAQGNWLDSVPWGHSKVFTPKIEYVPTIKVAPWYLPWWSTFFYEATSEEYSLSIPHDVPGLIEACGGKDKFKERLDLFFEKNYYNVANEPSFMTPLLYHWIDHPDLSTARVHQIIRNNYNDTPDGLPGNDDSGAVSSWLVFNMLGFYPNAGQNQYIVTAPLVEEYTIHLSNGKDLHVTTPPNLPKGEESSIANNGTIFITHEDIMNGGELILQTSPNLPKVEEKTDTQEPQVTNKVLPLGGVSGGLSFILNRQYRTWPFGYQWNGDELVMTCNGATYNIPRYAVENSDHFCWDSPQKGNPVYNTDGTFAFISKKAYKELCDKGVFTYDNITWRKINETNEYIEVRADIDWTVMKISKTMDLPIVLEMKNNPLGIDWDYSPTPIPLP